VVRLIKPIKIDACCRINEMIYRYGEHSWHPALRNAYQEMKKRADEMAAHRKDPWAWARTLPAPRAGRNRRCQKNRGCNKMIPLVAPQASEDCSFGFLYRCSVQILPSRIFAKGITAKG
jgi:hypothetical protein